MSEPMPQYVYGIVERKAPAPSGEGIGGTPLRVIADDGAAALVSELQQRELTLGREELLAHARVLENAVSSGTVLPMRFGIVMEGEEEVRQRLLQAHCDELRTQLERFSDKVEVSIRATYDEQQLMREVVAENPDVRRLRESVRSKPPITSGSGSGNSFQRRWNISGRRIPPRFSRPCGRVLQTCAWAPEPTSGSR